MPKSLSILPSEVRGKGAVEFTPIPVNQYDRKLKDELDRFAREDLVRIHRDMAVIRAFENMLYISLWACGPAIMSSMHLSCDML